MNEVDCRKCKSYLPKFWGKSDERCSHSSSMIRAVSMDNERVTIPLTAREARLAGGTKVTLSYDEVIVSRVNPCGVEGKLFEPK